MTPLDRSLDPALIFDQSPILLYRLARTRFANLSGIGAALSRGRWNVSGQQAIYTSMEISLTVLERLVHTPKDQIPDDLALMTIRVEGDWTRGASLLRQGAAEFQALASLNAADEFFRARAENRVQPAMPFALALPSVVVPAWNVVLYPQAEGFWNHVFLVSVDPFVFDPRLFPDAASNLSQLQQRRLIRPEND